MVEEFPKGSERGPKQKRRKMIGAETRVLSLLNFKDLPSLIRELQSGVRGSWDLKPLIPFLKNQSDPSLVWWSVTCIGLILNLSDLQIEELRRKCGVLPGMDSNLGLEFQNQLEMTLGLDYLFTLSGTGPRNEGFVPIGGIPVESEGKCSKGLSLVEVGSLVASLREIGISLATFEPICILGPVGSGKTSLLHYAASKIGRNGYPTLISVQISDQVDSRLLLGSYHSTDLPGQFVWKAGPLTKALLQGHWVILEDMDSAPADLTALLHGLIETRKVFVPGFGEIQKFHPKFRLFATWRTQTGSRNERVGRDWKQIVVEGMSSDEMKTLVSVSFPHLQPILDRLLSLFRTIEDFQAQIVGSSRRRLSLRDFLKFCRRIPASLNLMETEAAIWMFQEACDVFLASLHNPEWKQEVAESIGTHLNLLKAKTEYFLTAYQPHVSICTNSNKLTAGRHTLSIMNPFPTSLRSRDDREVFSLTKRACRLLEMISGSVKYHEPVLLIGETGVGKTSAIQYLAKILQQQLLVVNLNRQSDSGDLLGGYKPVELKYIFSPIRQEFETLFPLTFSNESNSKFIAHIMTCFANRRWKDLLDLMTHVLKAALAKLQSHGNATRAKIRLRWEELGHQLSRLQLQLSRREGSPFAFSFIEGTLIRAIKNGHWILLDEINLATPEMLQCLSGVLEEDAEIHLWEKGDETPIRRHPNFHLFAAMNPATDVGKKDLPLGLRNRFTEYYVEELRDRKELEVLVADYLRDLSLSSIQVGNIVEFYMNVKELSETSLVDGTGKKPHFSLRTLCRALKISALNLYGSVNRSLYESFCLSFLTQLDYSSHPIVHSLVAKHIFGKTDIKSLTNQPLPAPSGRFIQVEGYWIPQGDSEPVQPPKYIVTSSIRRNLKDLVRIVSAGKLPVLIQGETSVGKTSLIEYLAKVSGNRCYRINNHQHTDLQEYVGSYQSDSTGKLVFTEGVLVNAMRRGEWIILDELNLAPSEVLEALNRLLDDNRQLFVTETGQTVSAHPRFMLFATQNPPGLYGGRKLLSRAFRNRFVELHFDEIPGPELETILHLRCDIPASYCKKIIGVLRELQMRRKASAALQGKHGFATLRDLFRWAERYRQSGKQEVRFYDWDQHLADEGYLVLAGKVRKASEAELIIEVLEKFLKRRVDPNNLFSLHEKTSSVTRELLEKVLNKTVEGFEHIVWTFQMRRLAVLIGKGMEFQEPVLLVGETGCGKTSVVQLLARLSAQPLYALNCHMHSEGSDFLGGLRPRRNHSANDGGLFEWVDGPLIEAMEAGGIFLADEISLADDSVLERINSVLEPERSLLLAEKGEEIPKLVVALSNFHFIATMNPGGDYGKKELSPALRNRVTEIWCEVTTSPSDLESIIEHNLDSSLRSRGIGTLMLLFVGWLKRNDLGQRCTVSIRDYLSWTQFLNHVLLTTKDIGLSSAIQHGASLAFLDGLGTGTTATQNLLLSKNVKTAAAAYLEGLCTELKLSVVELHSTAVPILSITSENLGIGPFFIPKGAVTSGRDTENGFNFEAPTTSTNGLRVLRAMQLKKPILLEGSPGVGKTALVTALAQMSRHSIVRINLSEQTDISDLFGADLPVEGGQGGEFAWRDGPLLQALKNSSWILLDELNLASQSVLEGLNACLDHRSEVYVPELNRTFQVGAGGSRIFGCQNPVRQGGARKGLPKSFLNRFTQVFMDPLSLTDLEWILHSSYPALPSPVVRLMSTFADSLGQAVNELGLFGSKGSPWDFNLRDLLRWASLVVDKGAGNPSLFVDFIYGRRMRTREDTQKILALYSQTCAEFGVPTPLESLLLCGQTGVVLLENQLVVGNGALTRVGERGREANQTPLLVLQKQLPALEGLTLALEMGWMPILVGPSGAGKTSLVKLVSELSGQTLRLLTVSPEMDTIELLGGFEQADVYRKVEEAAGGVREVVGRGVKWIFCRSGPDLNLMDSQFLDLWSSLNALPHLTPGVRDGEDEEKVRIRTRVDLLDSALRKCRKVMNKDDLEIGAKLKELELELEEIKKHLQTGIQTGAFQWVHSILIKSILRGEWLVIEGANRCTAAVLDRLNSLMEPNGSLFLSERGSIDGEIIEVKPHPNFRLILTMDPVHGEISRAMRNRGVEIFIPGPEEVSTPTNVESSDNKTCLGNVLEWRLGGRNVDSESWVRGINLLDLDALLRAHGLLDPALRKSLINFHGQIYEALAPTLGPADRPHISQLVQLVRSMVLEAEHGVCREDGIRNALASVYRKISPDLLTNFKLPINSDSPSKPRLSLTFPNFLNSQMYRVWKEMDSLVTAFSPYPVQTLQNSLQSVKNETLFQDLLIAASFTRLVKEDCAAFASALLLKFPDKTNLISSLGSAINSLPSWSSREGVWDWQWSPHALARLASGQILAAETMAEAESILKTSLALYQPLLSTAEKSWANGSLGFVAKNVKQGRFASDSLENTNLLASLSLLLQDLDSLLTFALRNGNLSGNGMESLERGAALWKEGMSTFLWRRRLFSLAHQLYNPRMKNEKLDSKIRLLMGWIEQEVQPFVCAISSSSHSMMKELATRCFGDLDHLSVKSRVLLRSGALYRELIHTKPFPIESASKSEAISSVIQCIFSLWSLTPVLLKRKLIHALNSEPATILHAFLTALSSRLLDEFEYSTDEMNALIEIQNGIESTKNAEDLENPIQSKNRDLEEFTAGLREYVRISESRTNSGFANPILVGKAFEESGLSEYLGWEEKERFLTTFLDAPYYGLLPNSCFIPHFVASLLLEGQTGLRNPSVGSRSVVSTSLETLNSVLTQNILTPPRTHQNFVSGLANNFGQMLERTGQSVGWEWAEDRMKCWIEALDSEGDRRQMGLVGSVMVEAGASLIQLAAALPVVDPAVEKEISAQYLTDEIEFFETWLTAQNVQELLGTGSDIYTRHPDTVHPYIVQSTKHLLTLYDRLAEAKKNIAYRPDPPAYAAIRQDINQFRAAFASVEKMKVMVQRFLGLMEAPYPPNEEELNSVLVPCHSWIDAHKNFVKKLTKEFWYWDITAPFLFASIQVSIGVSLMCDSIRTLKLGPNLTERETLFQLVRFPIEFSESPIEIPADFSLEHLNNQQLSSKLFLSTIVSFMNEVETEEHVSRASLKKLHSLSKSVAWIWKRSEEEKAREKELKDAMYLYKGRERSMELSEEEQEAQDLSSTFPAYDDDLIGLEIQNSLDDGRPSVKDKEAEVKNATELLSPQDITIFLKVHERVVGQVKNHWIAGQHNSRQIEPVLDFVTPFMTRFEVGCSKFSEYSKFFGKEEETKFLIGANIAVDQIQSNYESPDFFRQVQLYDFYHDSNIDEVRKLSPIFIGLRKRVDELLVEWPEHPALQKVLEILSRIESFQMKSPLMKFLTGVELLLGHAQEWETCAHAGVSIALYLTEITDLIISWRKLELQCWKNLLEITLQREAGEGHKWWFHLYSVVMEVVQSPKAYLLDPSHFLLNLHQFMETSPIGQFENRLRYLYNIHAHLISVEQTGGAIPEFLHAYVWNTLSYYTQFREPVRVRLTSLRTPIERKMKDFVKISRWNDANYYALKASVLKSQKMLTKLVKEWKKALRIPVSTVLVADLNASDTKEKKQAILRVPKQKLYLMPEILNAECQLEADLLTSLNVKRLRKLPKIYGKVQTIVKHVLQTDVGVYMEEIGNLNQFSAQVIDTSHELQNIEMNDKKVGKERKKMLHNIHSRRRAGLADLFKFLQDLNLSYRRGLVQMKGVESSQGNGKLHHDFCMEPMDITAAWTHVPQNQSPGADKELVMAWNGCELYYQKCIARIAVMMKSFESPSKELGPAIVDRCKGFTADLMNITSGQKQFIGNFTSLLWILRLLSSNNFSEGKPLSHFQRFHQEAARVEYETKQLLLVVTSLKEGSNEDLKLRLNEALGQIVRKCRDIKALLGIYVTSVTIPHLPKKLMDGKKDTSKCQELLQEICDIFQNLESNSVLGNSFRKLKEGTLAFLQKIAEDSQNEPESSDGKSRKAKLVSVVDKILQNMLLTFQKLEKLKLAESQDKIIEVLGQDFGGNLRKLAVLEISCFEIDQLVQGLLSLFRILRKENDSELSGIFNGLVPLLQQYSLLAQFYLMLFVQYHRATCKLLSILSALFATLGSKGFCLPSDYEQDAQAEGPEMDASGGMGLGEGDTTPDAQDVSDRLESEDQLEDTLKEGETVAPADKDLNDDEKGVEMSEDFDGKQQDKEDREKGGDEEDKGSESSDSETEEDLDKEMGEVDDPENKLDEQMWGGSSDEEEEDTEEKEDTGKGAPQKSEPEIRAKDPTLEQQESDSEEKDKPEDDDKNKKGKELNEQDENEELNDDQVDPYHGQNEPEQEPEALDLPDDLNLDNAEAKDEEGPEENPFDLDSKEMEDSVPEGPEEEKEEEVRDENQVSDDDDPEADKGVDVEKPTFEDESESAAPEDKEVDKEMDNEGKVEEEEPMDVDEEAKVEENEEKPVEGESEEGQEKAEPSEETRGKSQDQTQVGNEKAKPDPKDQPMEATDEENSSKKDETASGQAESQDGRGHEGQSVKKEQNQVSRQDQKDNEATRKPGDTDENRSLANEAEPKESAVNRLKTLDRPKESDDGVNPEEHDSNEANDNGADLYEHIRDGEKNDSVTIDNATKEQAEKQRGAECEKSEEAPKLDDTEEDEVQMDTTEEIEQEKRDHDPADTRVIDKSKRKGEQTLEKSNDEMEIEIEGEKALTFGAARPAHSTIETRMDLLEQWRAEKRALDAVARRDVLPFTETHMTFAEESAALTQWHELDGKTLHLAQELCEQLRLVLEPTQAARLKGDYKTGKRLNMRKVIPYIASGFRKDKIWLRRTQPSKREYQILLALDDSASMSDNQSKQMAFSAVAVVARSLGLLEAGQLAVVGFGEEAELLHPFDEPFTDQSGAKLLNRFTFAQRSTRMAELLSFSTALFADAKEKRPASSALSAEVAQLLLIVSDGRGVCHQGSDVVQKAVRRAREENVFIVFIIVDNPENKDSILDTRLAIFGPNKTVEIGKYMDHFPFPFYLILRDLSTLPSVLSDALRQWFELVTSSER